MIILVTGAPRCGVALVGGVLKVSGAFGGDIDPPYFHYDGRENMANEQIHEALVGPMLRGLKADPRGLRKLPTREELDEVAGRVGPQWRRHVMRIFERQGAQLVAGEVLPGHKVFYASSQTMITWPVWNAAFPDAQWVIARRDESHAARACQQSKFLVPPKPFKEWKVLQREYVNRLSDLIDSGASVYQVWPKHLIDGSLAEVEAMVAHLGLPWDDEKVEDFVSPITWKGGVFEFTEGAMHG